MAALGLSRAHDKELLAAAEPDVLVTSLDDIDLDALAQGRLAQRTPNLMAAENRGGCESPFPSDVTVRVSGSCQGFLSKTDASCRTDLTAPIGCERQSSHPREPPRRSSRYSLNRDSRYGCLRGVVVAVSR